MNDNQKDELITSLLGQNIYKTSDGRHLYEVSLEDLEREYKHLLMSPNEESS